MKIFAFAATAALSLSMATAAGAQMQAQAQAQAAPELPYAFTASYFVGEWVDGPSCEVDRLVMRADGTFTAPGGGSGKWSLNGNRLTFGSGATATTFTVLPVSRELVYTYYDEGGSGYSKRC
ncbi:hypothetical protein [Alteriqipengyuania sp. 357]